MIVLIFAAGSFLMFLAVLACLFVAHTLESREIARMRNIWRHAPLKLLSIPQAFEPVYAPLWEAPITALQITNSSGGYISAARLYSTFRRAAARFPEIYDGCEFAQWLEFLQSEELIYWDRVRNTVAISDQGKEFLANRFVTDALLEA